jgi:hypothetical protein
LFFVLRKIQKRSKINEQIKNEETENKKNNNKKKEAAKNKFFFLSFQ